MSFIQYLKDTRGELHHVAWPTQMQTIVYTVLVTLLSVFVALYLGLFDFLFTTGLARVINVLPKNDPITITQQPAGDSPFTLESISTSTSTPQ